MEVARSCWQLIKQVREASFQQSSWNVSRREEGHTFSPIVNDPIRMRMEEIWRVIEIQRHANDV